MSPEVIIALIGIIGTLIGTLGATALSNRSAAKREDVQWNRQINEQRRGELLNAYEDFIAMTVLSLDSPQSERAALWRALARVELLAPEPLAEQARELDIAVTAARQVFLKAETDEEERNKAAVSYLEAHEKFIAAVRRELDPQSAGGLRP